MRTFHPLLLLGAIACGPSNDAVWLFTVGDAEVTQSTFECTENFLAADCPTSAEPEPDEWTLTETSTQSPGAFFGQIIDAPSGQKLLVVDDQVFIGEKDSGVWRFVWEGFEVDDEQLVHESGYEFKTDAERRREQVFAIEIKGGEATGTAITRLTTREKVTESDGWLTEEVGFSFGQIVDASPTFLEGDWANFSDEAECSSSVCEIEVTQTVTIEVPITAIRTGEDGRSFDGVSGAGQDAGF